MQLQLKTWQFVEDYLKTKTGIIIPIGSTEQHEPTVLMRVCTDAEAFKALGLGPTSRILLINSEGDLGEPLPA